MKAIYYSSCLLVILLLNGCEEKRVIQKESDMVKTDIKLDPVPEIAPVYNDVDSLRSTQLFAYATAPIKKDQNIIYSGGASIAWKELKRLTGAKTMNLIEGPSWLPKLNSDPITKKDIDPKALSIIAGTGPQVGDSLEKIYGKRFSDSITDHEFIAIVKIFKKLNFPEEINSSTEEYSTVEDFNFMNRKVEHNHISGYEASHLWQYKFEVYDYKSDDHFIVKMPVKNDSTELYLAKIPPRATLKETYDYVVSKSNNKFQQSFVGGDRIVFPTINFNVFKNYIELLNPIAGTDYEVGRFEQYLKFSLSDKGVVLQDSVYAVADSTAAIPEKPKPVVPKKLYFNSPFLIVMKEKNSKAPYFLMWVGNADLMIEEKK